MRIREVLNKKRTFSLEIFPPKLENPLEPVIETINKLDDLHADFISVTYGAGGTNKGRNNEICQYVLDKGDNLVSHFTSIGNTRSEAIERVKKYVGMGGDSILALRGDYPEGWTGTGGDYKYATELIKDLVDNFPQLCVGGACYPEKHYEAPSLEEDVKVMKLKEEFGCEFFISQLCYDLEAYKRFMDVVDKTGVASPIVVGLLPVIGRKGVLKITSDNACNIPKELQTIFDKYEDPADFKKAGLEYTKDLVEKYLGLGVSGIHLYTMNKWQDIREIVLDTSLNNLK